jgi:hypothetical protein
VFVLYEVRVQATILGVSGQLSCGIDLGLNSPVRSVSEGEIWKDPQGGDPSSCRLIRGDRELRA